MTSPTFLPWKPTGDPRFNGLRLLIVGESHYDEGEPPPAEQVSSFTSEIVTRWGANAEGYTRFFGNIYATFNDDGAHWSSDEFKRFWNSVYFYNYVQSFVEGNARVRPTAEQFSESADAFHAVLDELKPEGIVVVGQTIWDSMSDRGAKLVERDEDGLGSIYRYEYNGGTCLAGHTHHPSSIGYSADYWKPRVKRFLKTALEGNAAFHIS